MTQVFHNDTGVSHDDTSVSYNDKRVGFNIFEAFPYPGITGQNWPLSRKFPGFNFFLNKGKLTTKKKSYAFQFCQ